VDVFEDVGTDDGVQVGVHEVEHEVDVTIVLSADHVLKTDYVFVPSQLLQEDDLAEGALSIRGVLESVEVLFERDDFLGALVNRLPDDAVGSLT